MHESINNAYKAEIDRLLKFSRMYPIHRAIESTRKYVYYFSRRYAHFKKFDVGLLTFNYSGSRLKNWNGIPYSRPYFRLLC